MLFLFNSKSLALDSEVKSYHLDFVSKGYDSTQGDTSSGGVRSYGTSSSIIEAVILQIGLIKLVNIDSLGKSAIVEIIDINNVKLHTKVLHAYTLQVIDVSIFAIGNYNVKVFDTQNHIL